MRHVLQNGMGQIVMSKNTNRNRLKRQRAMQKTNGTSGNAGRRRVLAIAAILVAAIVVSIALYELEFSQKRTPAGNSISGYYPSLLDGFSKISASPTTIDGKIPFLFIGSMACPHCAEMSWSVYSALKLVGGTWNSLGYIYSNATDQYPNTPGLSFANATYYSSAIAFLGYEISNRQWEPYQTLNNTNQALFSEYDPSGGIPFILIGGMYLHIGDFYLPSILANTTANAIMSWLSGGTSNTITENIHNVSANITNVITELENHSITQLQVYSTPSIYSISMEARINDT